MISERGNINFESGLKFPAKSPRVLSDVALKDDDYIFPCQGQQSRFFASSAEKKHKHGKKKSVSASCQTDIDQLEMEELVRNVARLKIENKVLRNKVISAAFLQSFSCSALFLFIPSTAFEMNVSRL